MLHHMPSPSAHSGEVAFLSRTLEARLCHDASSGASSDAAEEFDLPQCKIKRNYNCSKCNFYTQNPRAYLLHSREVHFEKFRIYDCPQCVYASRHYQKLTRHVKMVHDSASSKIDLGVQTSISEETVEPVEQAEDLLEEVEDCEDFSIGVDDSEPLQHIGSVDSDICRNVDVSILGKHKGKYFSCDKCNYVTHIKSRFTKHVKYHSMPMIKCTLCDFRTPYKWNLDRHMKNHGGTGSFNCSMCNFTADIKQSLTVHEMNHHTSAGQSGGSRRRNRVGASDLTLGYSNIAAKDDEGSGDSHSSYSASDMGLHADIEMVTCNSESNDATASEDIFKNDNSRSPDLQNNSSSDDSKFSKYNKKPSRPIPQLIPLNVSTPNQSKSESGEPPNKKLKLSTASSLLNSDDKTTCESQAFHNKESTIRKKNESFFDKLKERILTETGGEGSLVCKNCGFKSKCLSELSVHEKVCSPVSKITNTNTTHSYLSSTRCQNCRHRCKSSADLYNHLQTCKKIDQTDNFTNADTKSYNTEEVNNSISEDHGAAPHPMENVVFVWNKNHDDDQFVTPLDININDDSTLPEVNRSLESEIVDENDGLNLSPSQAAGKKVFKCPHCPFWASTASRFHVHIVGHLNKKPFECSLCKYKSNWRWDITKHIKLKSARDPEHLEAKVLMTDETGRRNYSKYNKYLAVSILNESGETEFRYVDPSTPPEAMVEVDESVHGVSVNATDTQPLNLQTYGGEQNNDSVGVLNNGPKKLKKTLWKCKKCNYKDPSKEALLEHVREHSRSDGMDNAKKLDNTPDPSDLAYRCGHCNQLSNWKHVIQRHCRLKHDGIIKVITTLKPKPDPNTTNEVITDACSKCPFKSEDKKALLLHLQQHQPSSQSIFKCYFCPYFVKNEHELMQHLVLHGVNEPEDYIAKAMGCKSPLPDQQGGSATVSSSNKRHKCIECPYETNSKSQFMYHEQFHKLSVDTPYKCQECNYSVSKRHLLHQHMRVHGIFTKKNEMDTELDSTSSFNKSENNVDDEFINIDEIPYVWVSAKNEFHKMYKCRYCSYVNSQKCKIPNHEKIHCIEIQNNELTLYKCLECKFTSYSAGQLASHAKGHGEIYGRIYCPVEEDIPDEEQIAKLRKVLETEKANNPDNTTLKDEWIMKEHEGIKLLFFCQKCPTRFFTDSELRIHDKFHDLSFNNKCKSCEFSVPLETDIITHTLVHTDEYRTKTKMLKFMHNSDPAHKEPKLELLHCPVTSEITWVVANPSKNYETDYLKKSDTKHHPKQYWCKDCPAKFLKSSALSHHTALHGGEGDHKCRTCSYAVKNSGNLAKHELIHDKERNTVHCDYESGDDIDYKNIPLSGTDLFQRKTEAQKRVLIDKDKLVKPNDHFPPVLQADPQFGYLMHGNPEFIYPTYLKNGRQKEKRYKCHKCPSAFEKREQYKIHLSLHGSKQRYKCEICDYSVKYYANYVQHMRKHQMNDEAQAERNKDSSDFIETDYQENKVYDNVDNIKLAIKTMPRGVPKSDFQQFSVSDQQTLRLLQRRRSINNLGKESNTSDQSPTKERKLHMCLLCPYTNQRQDALTNHYKRHDDTDAINMANHKCSFCDLVVIQSHFLREHMKAHFSYQKNLNPECFVANEDVSFTVTKVDENEEAPTDLILENSQMYSCNEDKIFVKVHTGELLVAE